MVPRVHDGQEGGACRIHTQRARPETDRQKAVCPQERELERIPSALGSYGEEDPLVRTLTERRTDRPRRAGIRDEAKAVLEQPVQMILHEDLELAVDGDGGQASIAGLLESFDEQRTVARFRQDVRVEILPLDSPGVRQDDLPDSERGQLGPEAAHDLRPGKGEQQINAGPRRRLGLECATQADMPVSRGLHRSDPQRSIEQSHANSVPRRHLQHVQQVCGTGTRERDPVRIEPVMRFEKDEVHPSESYCPCARWAGFWIVSFAMGSYIWLRWSAMLYLIVERFRNGDPIPVYQRFREHGRLAPAGVTYVASWVTQDLKTCYQIMEAADRGLLQEWLNAWSDLVEFEVVSVMTSAEAAAAVVDLGGRRESAGGSD
jgi:uncharacterized protein DUF3303